MHSEHNHNYVVNKVLYEVSDWPMNIHKRISIRHWQCDIVSGWLIKSYLWAEVCAILQNCKVLSTRYGILLSSLNFLCFFAKTHCWACNKYSYLMDEFGKTSNNSHQTVSIPCSKGNSNLTTGPTALSQVTEYLKLSFGSLVIGLPSKPVCMLFILAINLSV